VCAHFKGKLLYFGNEALHLHPQADELVDTIFMSVSSMKEVLLANANQHWCNDWK
jgi:hypothetical protein